MLVHSILDLAFLLFYVNWFPKYTTLDVNLLSHCTLRHNTFSWIIFSASVMANCGVTNLRERKKKSWTYPQGMALFIEAFRKPILWDEQPKHDSRSTPPLASPLKLSPASKRILLETEK